MANQRSPWPPKYVGNLSLDITFQPKQQLLLDAIRCVGPDTPDVLLFGGSRGSAKSGGVRRIAIVLAISEPCIIWIIRRVWDDLNKDHILPLWEEYPDLRQFWHAGEKKLVIPLGDRKTSTIFFIHAGVGGRAKRKARGPQARYIFLEQAEEFTQEEMEQLAGSNREKGVGVGVCKRIYTFNPGGVGTAYLRRIAKLGSPDPSGFEHMENERHGSFLFIQGFGWDNYEWFRFLGIGAEEFYALPEQERFDMFITRTDFGRKLNQLPPAQRIGELMGSFDQFGGQYYIDVWEQSSIVLDPAIVAQIVQPWWVRWLATDWGRSHFAATYWACSGIVSPAVILHCFGLECATPIRIIIVYREFVCREVSEPQHSEAIVKLTSDSEKREIKDYWLSPDAWARHGGGNTIQEQLQPVLSVGGLPELQPAKNERVGGWRLLHNCWAMARRLRKWEGPMPFEQHAQDPPCLFISAACPELIKAVPMLICDEKDPKDIRKIPGAVEDDCADSLRYLIKSYLDAAPKPPDDVIRRQVYDSYQDPNSRAMAMRRLEAEQAKGRSLQRRRRG